ncbi:hypothetical protein Bca4012_010527 [Brassica carinata]
MGVLMSTEERLQILVFDNVKDVKRERRRHLGPSALPLSRCAQMETVKATVSLEHVLEQAMESVGEMGKAISSVQTVTSEVDSLCDMVSL